MPAYGREGSEDDWKGGKAIFGFCGIFHLTPLDANRWMDDVGTQEPCEVRLAPS